MRSMLIKLQVLSFPVIVAGVLTVLGVSLGNYSLAVLSAILTATLASIPAKTFFGAEGIQASTIESDAGTTQVLR